VRGVPAEASPVMMVDSKIVIERSIKNNEKVYGL
jgi:hypothetical protein